MSRRRLYRFVNDIDSMVLGGSFAKEGCRQTIIAVSWFLCGISEKRQYMPFFVCCFFAILMSESACFRGDSYDIKIYIRRDARRQY